LVLGDGGELTPRLAVDPKGLTSMGFVARRLPRIAAVT
jgi:hypothetical protein